MSKSPIHLPDFDKLSTMDLAQLQQQWAAYVETASTHFQKIPGSAILLRYIRSSYQNDPIRSVIELVLVIFFVRYLMAPSYSTHRQGFVQLSEEEIDDLVDDWQPEPLVAPLTQLEEQSLEKLPVIVGAIGPKSKLSNGRTVTNLASYNHYNLINHPILQQRAIETLRTYGVGPCGPPQFYGTQDVHMKTEADIAAHLGMDACIVYAHAFSVISSVIPAFSKRGDIIVADKAVNFAIRKGLQICRSKVLWYEHNDMEDLERVLAKVVKDQARKPLTRRFIVTEGLFENVGDMAPLPTIISLRLKYKFRLILDETWSFGVLGRTGRGLTEHQNVDPSSIDMIVGALSGPLCAGGGFCAGSADIVEHQRITSASYTFSAALPAMMATTASEALAILQQPEGEHLITTLRENIKTMRAQLDPRSDWLTVTSSPENPIVLAVLKPEVVASRRYTLDEEERVLQECVDEALAQGVLITRLKSMPPPPGGNPMATNGTAGARQNKEWQLQPALKICLTTGLSKKEVEKAGTVVRHAVTKVLTRGRGKLGVPAV